MEYINSILDMIQRENPGYEFLIEDMEPFLISYRKGGTEDEWVLFARVEDHFIFRF